MAGDVSIVDFLAEAGFDTLEAQAAAREALETEGLTRPGKVRMSLTKIVAARVALDSKLIRACAQCLGTSGDRLASDRQLIVVSSGACTVCQGSDNRRAVHELAVESRRAGLQRLLVVGGTPVLHDELMRLLKQAGSQLTIRAIDGAEGVHTRNEATAHLQWAQVAVIWASTPLPHKVSEHYTRHPRSRETPVVTCRQRGIAALCGSVISSLASATQRESSIRTESRRQMDRQ